MRFHKDGGGRSIESNRLLGKRNNRIFMFISLTMMRPVLKIKEIRGNMKIEQF